MSTEPMVSTFPTRQQAQRFLNLVRQFDRAIPVGGVQLTDDGGYAVAFYRPTLTADSWQRFRRGGTR